MKAEANSEGRGRIPNKDSRNQDFPQKCSQTKERNRFDQGGSLPGISILLDFHSATFSLDSIQ